MKNALAFWNVWKPHRGGIFVDKNANKSSSPVGATSSDDAVPNGTWMAFGERYSKKALALTSLRVFVSWLLKSGSGSPSPGYSDLLGPIPAPPSPHPWLFDVQYSAFNVQIPSAPPPHHILYILSKLCVPCVPVAKGMENERGHQMQTSWTGKLNKKNDTLIRFTYNSPMNLNKLVIPVIVALGLLAPALLPAQTQPVIVTVSADSPGPAITPDFLGLSYESSMLLPNSSGQYYFRPDNTPLINTFKTLGIKSLRVGANAVDDPRVAIPGEPDIDPLFKFAHAADAKVIYSFRLKNGDPSNSARLATYINANYADDLDAFAIGNEPSFYLTNFSDFLAVWKPHYDAILKAVPNAMFDGPSVARANIYAVQLADAIAADGHLAMASDHYYFLGSGRAAEKNPTASRGRFLQDKLHADYQKNYGKIGGVLASKGVPYRIDEMNSCYNGGARDSSDTYASTLWALDCTHWWAAHHILGVNFHTGEAVGRDGGFGAANYAAFVHEPDGHGYAMRPQAYAYLAFTQGARGKSLVVSQQSAPDFNFDSYAFKDTDGSYYVTLINKSYGDNAQPAKVAIQIGQDVESGSWKEMDLVQAQNDVAAKTGVTLGGASVNPNGIWKGKWKKIKHAGSSSFTIEVPAASAMLLRFSP